MAKVEQAPASLRNAEERLSALLSETPRLANVRAAEECQVGDDDLFVLYGAGTIGRDVLKRLRKVGKEPVAFVDDTPGRHGELVDGVPVRSVEEIVQQFGNQILFVVTILNPQLSYLGAKSRLEGRGAIRVKPFISLCWKFPQTFLPYYQFELPGELLSKKEDIWKAFRLLSDEESRDNFVRQIEFRLYLRHEVLPAKAAASYFTAEVRPYLTADLTYVDCGAFDGDTIKEFFQHGQNRFRKVVAFEPDEKNFAALNRYVAGLGSNFASKIDVFKAGVGAERKTLKFNSTGNMSASLADSGSCEINIIPLDELKLQSPVYIKFDVEGAELDALKGCVELIGRADTLLAISVYHRPDDLWQLPLFVNEVSPTYRYVLRTHGDDGTDVVCYALPNASDNGVH